MTNQWTNREILRSYFMGMIDLQIEYMDEYPDSNNQYRRDNEPFIRDIKRVLDEFSLKLTPELKDMYKLKYREKRAFGEFYNVVAPTSYIVALNNELNAIVSKIERPQPRLYAQSVEVVLNDHEMHDKEKEYIEWQTVQINYCVIISQVD